MENLEWMRDEALKQSDDASIFHGFLLVDEMSIQEDLQIVKRGDQWRIVGSVDLGPIATNLDSYVTSQTVKMATHCLQFLFVSYSGFRWPVCHYASDNVNGHSLYFTMWPLVSKLQSFGFTVHGALMDGSSNNR